MRRLFVSVRQHEEVCGQRDELMAQRDEALALAERRRRESVAHRDCEESATSRELQLHRRLAEAYALVERMLRLSDSPRETVGLNELAAVLRGER